MSSLRQVFELSRRDFLQRAKSRAFLISMLVTVGLVVAIGPLLAAATGEPDPSVVGLVGSTDASLTNTIVAQGQALDLVVVTRQYGSREEADQALEDGSADVVLVNGTDLVWRQEASPRLAAVVTGAVSMVERRRVASELGLDSEELSTLLNPVAFTTDVLDQPDPEREPRRAAAFVGLLVLYVSIFMFGQFVFMGVMEEKQNRVVEVVLSRVRPTQVLTGKVIGVGLLGLVQVVALGAAGLFVVSLIHVANVNLSAIGFQLFAWVLFWYLLGYSFYSMLYGALGATVSRQEDMQGAVMLPVLMIVPGIIIGQVAVEVPDGALARIASIFPLWSPMVMPVRSAVTDVPAWEVGLSIALILAGTYGLVRLGGRIYTGAILKLGTRVRLREAWRSAKG